MNRPLWRLLPALLAALQVVVGNIRAAEPCDSQVKVRFELSLVSWADTATNAPASEVATYDTKAGLNVFNIERRIQGAGSVSPLPGYQERMHEVGVVYDILTTCTPASYGNSAVVSLPEPTDCHQLEFLDDGEWVPASGNMFRTFYNSERRSAQPQAFRVVRQDGAGIQFEPQVDEACRTGPLANGDKNTFSAATDVIAASLSRMDGPEILCWKLLKAPEGSCLEVLPGNKRALIYPGGGEGEVVVQAKGADGCPYTGRFVLMAPGPGCDACRQFGNTSVESGSVSLKFHIGKDGFGKEAGYLYLHAEANGPGLYKRSAWKCWFEEVAFRPDLPNCAVIRDNPRVTADSTPGPISQVHSPSGMIVVTETAAGMRLSAYPMSDVELPAVGAQDVLRSPWNVRSGAIPMSMLEVTNPDPSGTQGPTNSLVRVVETQGGSARIHTFRHSGSGNVHQWSLRTEGSPVETVSRSTGGSGVLGYDRSVLVTSNGVSVERSRSTRAFGVFLPVNAAIPARRPVGTTNGLGAEAITEAWTYYPVDAADPNRRGRLQAKTKTGAPWTRFLGYDAAARPTVKLMPFEDLPSVSQDPATGATDHYFYTVPTSSGEDLSSIKTGSPRAIVHCVRGHVLSLEFFNYRYRNGVDNVLELVHVVCPTPTGDLPASGVLQYLDDNYRSAGNIRTVHLYEPDSIHELGRPMGQREPDGTGEVHFPRQVEGVGTQAILTETVDTGRLNTNDEVYDGERRITRRGVLGEILGRVTYRIVPQPESTVPSYVGPTEAETYQYGESSLRRDFTVTSLDRRTVQVRSGCCGDSVVIDKDGVTNVVQVDPARTFQVRTRLGISERTSFDHAGQPVRLERTGTDGTTVVLDQSDYDSLGRRVLSRNARSGATATRYDRATDLDVVTQTFPDASTRVEQYYVDGSLKAMGGTAAAPVRYTTEIALLDGVYRKKVTEAKLDAAGNPYPSANPEVIVQWFDGANRLLRTDRPHGGGWASTTYHFNALGQCDQVTDADGVVTFQLYDRRGRRSGTLQNVADTGAAAEINLGGASGLDRGSLVEESVATGTPIGDCLRTEVFLLTANGDPTWRLTARTDVSFDGLKRVEKVYRQPGNLSSELSTTTEVRYGADPTERSVVVMRPDGSSAEQAYKHGRLVRQTEFDARGARVSEVIHQHDAHGRPWTSRDLKGTTVMQSYAAGDLPETRSVTSGDGLVPAVVTSVEYDTSLRPIRERAPDGVDTFTSYHPGGAVKARWGGRTYPVEMTYDPQGRLDTLKTWTSFGGPTSTNAGPAITRWEYSSQGWVERKHHPDAATGNPQPGGVSFTYTKAGRLKQRTWQRGVTTTYTYAFEAESASGRRSGDLYNVTYSDGTSPVYFRDHDRFGRPQQVTRDQMTTRVTYDASGGIQSEAYAGGLLDGRVISQSLDDQMRVQRRQLTDAGGVILDNGYRYDASSRLQAVVDNLGRTEVVYERVPGSAAIESTRFIVGGVAPAWPRVTSRNVWDGLERLRQVRTVGQGMMTNDLPLEFTYDLKASGQRRRMTLGDASYWDYEYDGQGQLGSAKRYWSNGIPVAGQQFEYLYDSIGNRKSARSGGDGAGGKLDESVHVANRMNQYTSRTVPARMDVVGVANPAATVTVVPKTMPAGATNPPTSRRGDYFYASVPVVAGTWATVDVRATMAGSAAESASKSAWIPPSVEGLADVDPDGNPRSDSRWVYAWDAENRLVGVESTPGSVVAGAPWQRVTYQYDARGRLLQRRQFGGTAAAPRLVGTKVFAYAGWENIAVWSAEGAGTPGLSQTYVWGLDLSGTRAGAGGVGGLLLVRSVVHGDHAVAYDGNGNVAGLYHLASGGLAARYEYDAYGDAVSIVGTGVAMENPWRFSTKRSDEVTGLSQYEYRWYTPRLGRWLNRDFVGEMGGANLYGFVGNDPVNHVDRYGLYQNGGHYYSVYIAAIIAGWPMPDAMELAFYAQLPDQILSMTAFEFGAVVFLAAMHQGYKFFGQNVAPHLKMVQEQLHSLNFSRASSIRCCLGHMILSMNLERW